MLLYLFHSFLRSCASGICISINKLSKLNFFKNKAIVHC